MYQYYVDEKNRMVIAVCRYAGRNVRGTAKCSPDDEFDLELGKTLAKARCEEKKAKIKIQNASAKYMAAADEFQKAKRQLNKMRTYFMDAVDQHDDAVEAVNTITNEIK